METPLFRTEPRLILFTGIGTLFHLDHLDLFQNLEAMPSLGQQDYVPASRILLSR